MSMPRARVCPAASLLAVALVAAGTVVAGPTTAQESPDSTVNALLDALAAEQFDRLSDLSCEEERASVVSRFDVRSVVEGIPGFDAEAWAGAFDYSVEDRVASVVSESGDVATVAVSAHVGVEVDPVQARESVVALLVASDLEPTEAQVDEALTTLLALAAEGNDIEGVVRVVRERGTWVLCDDLSELRNVSEDQLSSPAPAEGHLCELASAEELSAIGPLSYASTDASVRGYCTYFAEEGEAFHSLTLLLDSASSDIDSMRQVFPDAVESTVAGLPALATDTELYVVTEAGALLVSAYIPEETAADLDLTSYLVAVAEVAAPRLLQMPLDPEASRPLDPSPFPSEASAEASICDLIEIDELNALAPLRYESTTTAPDACVWRSGLDGAPFTLSAWVEGATDIPDLESYLGDLEDTTVAGLPAAFSEASLYVATEKGVMGILADVPGWKLRELRAYAITVAEAIVPSWVEQP